MAEQRRPASGTGSPLAAPVTFSAPPSQGVPTARGSVAAVAPRGGLQGVREAAVKMTDTSGYGQAFRMNDRDIDELNKITAGVLGKKVEQAQTEAFWNGVKEAATGKALQDIIAEQPWYSQIFGDTQLVLGARAYTQQKILNDTAQKLTQEMPALRREPPEAVVGKFVGALDAMMTGDATTDAILQTSAAQTLPLLLKQHAAEHYAYLQEETKKAQFDSWLPMASQLQMQGEAYANQTLTEADFAAARMSALERIKPMAGQTPESYQSNMFTLYTKSAQDGNFHMVKLMDEQGIRSFFTPEQQQKLDDQVYRFAQRAKSQWVSANMAEDIAVLRSNAALGLQTPAHIIDTARMYNERFKAATGIDEDVVSVEQLGKEVIVSIYNSQKADGAKAQKIEAAAATTRIGFAMGYGQSSAFDLGLSAPQIDAAFRDTYEGADDKAKVLIDNAVRAPVPYVSKSLAGELRAVFETSAEGTWNAALDSSYQNWKLLAATPDGGMATAAAYYGDYHALLTQLDMEVQRGVPVETAYVKVFQTPFSRQPELTKDNRAALDAGLDVLDVKDGIGRLLPGSWSRKLPDASRNALSAIVAPKFDEFMQRNPGIRPEDAAGMLTAAMKASGELELFGSFVWPKQPSQVGLAQYVGAKVPQWLDEAVNDSMLGALKRQGLDSVDSFQAFRGSDEDGEPVIFVEAINENQTGWAVVRGAEIKAMYDKYVKDGRDNGERPEPVGRAFSQGMGTAYDQFNFN